jgi:hypothetical protein
MAERDEIRLGMRVRDCSGRELGTVVRKGEQRFLVQSGAIVKESLIVRDEHVSVVNEGEIVLSVDHRQLMDEMRHPPHKPAFVERYTYDEYATGTPRGAPVPPVEPAAALSEHPGKARVVREEVEIRSGSAHEYEVSADERTKAEAERTAEENPDPNSVHPVD